MAISRYTYYMKTSNKKLAQLFAETLLVTKDGETPILKDFRDNTVMSSAQRLKSKGWAASVIVVQTGDSMTFSVSFPGGRYGYSTDVLNRFLDEDTVKEYAEHALKVIIEKNDKRDSELLGTEPRA